jgi:phosphate starvation-inducible PhoH-like protein
MQYVNALNNPNIPIVVGVGPAGTGKTYLACFQAVDELLQGTKDKIILTRPSVTVNSEEFGFLPGGIGSKMDPFMRPIFDVFREKMDESRIQMLMKNHQIEICPLAFMRGRTFKDAFIIADEMQNSDEIQMKMLLTRIGENSRIVITGDIHQSDFKTTTKNHPDNGLVDLVHRIKKSKKLNNDDDDEDEDLIQLFILTQSDVARSRACLSVLKLYEE